MRLIAGLSPLSEGHMTVMGERLGERELRTPPELGVVLEQMGFLPHWSGRANLSGPARCSKTSTCALRARLRDRGRRAGRGLSG
jgi:ABC-type multidrug transport system ATPase subunit